MDLLEQVRLDDTYDKLNDIYDRLNNLDVGPSLIWVYAWAIIKDNLDYFTDDSGESITRNPALTDRDIFGMLWVTEGFTLEYGTEQLSEEILDWMLDRNILIDNEMDEE
jgi:hypothetical protein